MEEVHRELAEINAALERSRQPEAPARVGRHTKQDIFAKIKGSKYLGERVSLTWPKSYLIDAYITIEVQRLEGRKRQIEAELQEKVNG